MTLPMGSKLCVIASCMNLTTGGARCPVHEADHQRARNQRRGHERTPAAAYRKVVLVGQQCWCCGTTEDLTRHHVTPLALESAVRPDGSPAYFDPSARTPIVPMCRSCNSSIGARRMAGLACPLHGGQVAE